MNIQQEITKLKEGCGGRFIDDEVGEFDEYWICQKEGLCPTCKAKLQAYEDCLKEMEEERTILCYKTDLIIKDKEKEMEKRERYVKKLEENILSLQKVLRDIKSGTFKRQPDEEYEKEIKEEAKKENCDFCEKR